MNVDREKVNHILRTLTLQLEYLRKEQRSVILRAEQALRELESELEDES